MLHGNADTGHGQGDDSLCYVIGHGIDTVVGGSDHDRVIVCGRDGSPTAFLVEDGATYKARTGSTAADGQILVSADGALIMSLADIEEITICAAGPGDSLTVAGNFSTTMLGTDGLSFEGSRGRVDASAVTSGHRVRVGAAEDDIRRRGTGQRENLRAAEGEELLVFRTGGGATDEPADGHEW